ncbi:MAG: flagellar biosynthesis anti-sigma factor FlgM [Azospira sp.]|nr:flagellar biosynthesis anti-sigma factor FlgM [Azospira sp.]
MKIDSHPKPLPTGNVANGRPKAEAAGAKGDTATPAQVQISTTSAQLTAKADTGAPVNSARIAEIKQAIAEGRFKINPEAIADGLIDTARSLVQSQRRA